MTDIREHIQQLDADARVELYRIDATKYGLGEYRFVTGDAGDVVNTVTFDGLLYTPMPIKSKGWKVSGRGQAARPTLTVANIGSLFTPLVVGNNDLKGCTVTRIRTFARYLDDGVDADPSAVLPLDVYKINRKTRHTDTEIQWQLTSLIDHENAVLPNRMIVRDYCDLTYRVWDETLNGGAGGYTYETATCPYVGTDSFDKNDAVVPAAEDACGKRVGSCRARFGQNGELPFGGFPGVARFRGR